MGEQKISASGDLLYAEQSKRAGGDAFKMALITVQKQMFLESLEAARTAGNVNFDDVKQKAQTEWNDLQIKLQGRDPWGDRFDNVGNALIFLDTAGSFMKEANPGSGFSGVLSDIAKTGKAVMSLSWTQDWIKGLRSNAASSSEYDLMNQFLGMGHEANDKLVSECLGDLNCAKAYAQYDPATAGNMSIFDATPKGVVEAHPEVFDEYKISITIDNTDVIVDLDKLRGQIDNQYADIKQSIQTGMDQVQGSLSGINATLGDLSNGQQSILSWIAHQEEGQQLQQQQQAAAKLAHDAQLIVSLQYQTISSGLGAVSAIASIIDPKLGADIEKYGNAGMQVLIAGKQMIDACVALSQGVTAISGLASATATGNFIGAAFQLIGLMASADQPSPDQMILEGISNLRDQMAKFQEDVDARLNRIDTELQQIYKGVMAQFDYVDWKLGVLTEDINIIHTELTSLTLQLAGVESQVRMGFQTLDRSTLYDALDDALTRQQRGLQMPEADYAKFESLFYSWARPDGHAWSDIEQPVAGRPFDEDHLSLELGGTGLPGHPGDDPRSTVFGNMSYTAYVLNARGLTDDQGSPLPVPPLPNPAMWSIAAAAYAQLQQQYPDFAANTPSSRWQDVLQGSTDVTAYLRKLLGCTKMFKTLVSDYVQRATELGTTLDALVPTFVTEQIGAKLGRNVLRGGQQPLDAVLDIWGNSAQQFGFKPSWLNTMTCPGRPDLDTPANITSIIPPLYLVADWGHQGSPGDLKVVYEPSLDEQVVDGTPSRLNPNPDPIVNWCMHLTMTVMYKDTAIVRCHVVGPGVGDEQYPPADYDITYEWINPGNYKAMIEKATPIAAGSGQSKPSSAGKSRNPLETTAIVLEELSAAEMTAAAALAADVEKQVQVLFDHWRQALLASLASECSPGGHAYTQAARLQGLRLLIETVVTLVMWQASRNDDLLLACLSGVSQYRGGVRLPDCPDVQGYLINLDPATPVRGGHSTVLADWLAAYVKLPSELLGSRIAEWQALHSSGAYNEWYSVEKPPLLLNLSRSIVEWGQPASVAVPAGATSANQSIASAEPANGVGFVTSGTEEA